MSNFIAPLKSSTSCVHTCSKPCLEPPIDLKALKAGAAGAVGDMKNAKEAMKAKKKAAKKGMRPPHLKIHGCDGEATINSPGLYRAANRIT